jgi:hypothetical protein
MQSRDFAFWLQGFFELTPDAAEKGLTPHQTKMLQAHLSLVFQHDPSIAAKAHPVPANPVPPSVIPNWPDIYDHKKIDSSPLDRVIC